MRRSWFKFFVVDYAIDDSQPVSNPIRHNCHPKKVPAHVYSILPPKKCKQIDGAA